MLGSTTASRIGINGGTGSRVSTGIAVSVGTTIAIGTTIPIHIHTDIDTTAGPRAAQPQPGSLLLLLWPRGPWLTVCPPEALRETPAGAGGLPAHSLCEQHPEQ